MELNSDLEKDGDNMENFRFTAFEKTGEILFNEVWEFENEEEAKINGQKKIEE